MSLILSLDSITTFTFVSSRQSYLTIGIRIYLSRILRSDLLPLASWNPCFHSRENNMVRIVSRDEDVLGFRSISLQARGEQLPCQRRIHGGAEDRSGQRKGLGQNGAHGKEIVRIRRLCAATDQNYQVSSGCEGRGGG